MNRKMVFNMVGQITRLEAVMLALPMAVSLIYREKCVWAFLITAAVALAVGFALTLSCKPKNQDIYAKEGFVIVALAWFAMSAIGALPFVISGEIPSYIDAFFETVSGFTTTGASILANVEAMSHGLLFWRSFTHWIGGMGVLVLIVAILPTVSGRTIHILRAEMPGPTMGKLVPKLRDTAKILYLIYLVMTGLEIVLLLCGGMPLFDSVVHAFGTAGTGGFGIKADSVGGYSPYLQWVIAVFMLLFGVNFNLYYLLLVRRFRSAFRSSELWAYLGIAGAAAVAVAINIYPMYQNVGETARLAVFQVSSIMTTTGFSTTDFNRWPDLSKGILLLLMFIGGCAGSTAGGIKVSRVVLLFKSVKGELRRMLHPRSVTTVQFEGKRVDDGTLTGVGNYFVLFIFAFALLLLILSLESGFGFETNFSAAAACINNVGPGFGLVGPMSSFGAYSPLSKLALSLAMLFGRLEVYPILITLSLSTWIRK